MISIKLKHSGKYQEAGRKSISEIKDQMIEEIVTSLPDGITVKTFNISGQALIGIKGGKRKLKKVVP